MSHQHFTVVMILSFLFWGLKDGANQEDTLPKIKVIESSTKKVVLVVKPVVDKTFADSLSLLRGSLMEQRQTMDSIATDFIPKSEFDKLLYAQKKQNERLKRIFNKLPADVQRQIVVLDSLDSIQLSTPEKKSLSLPQISVQEDKKSFLQRLFKVFRRNKKQ